MIDLTDLGKIGFGSYRISDSPSHLQALKYALRNGVNLIDTASTYTRGESEIAIGKVLADLQRHKYFIMTKAGYVPGDYVETALKDGVPESEMVTYGDHNKHCIHPAYLRTRLNLSLARLRTKYADGFLIHNPEYYFQGEGQPTAAEYYRRIKAAFEFLEEQTVKGVIRYYGISSNTFTGPPDKINTTNLQTVLDIAREISSAHHFRLIQFPFNYYEQDACKIQYGSDSLLSLAKKHLMLTFANRPFNAHIPEGTLRLVAKAIPEDNDVSPNPSTSGFSVFKEVVQDQLRLLNRNEKFSDFGILKYTEANWHKFQLLPQHESVFQNGIYPFVELLFNNAIPSEIKEQVDQFCQVSRSFTLQNIRDRLDGIGKDVKKTVQATRETGMAELLCRFYLQKGLDHVLVGMRNESYINDLKSIWHDPD
jgi:aryl-alcohol dehydrogenase-like predicted oxidoreductase